MIVVGIVWEEGWFESDVELNLWKFPLKDLGVDEFAATPISGLATNKVKEFNNVQEMIEYYGLPVILATENGDINLREFEHPKNALYLFNRTTGGEMPVNPDYTLSVETKINKGMLWGHQAASIILYDRLIKEWQ